MPTFFIDSNAQSLACAVCALLHATARVRRACLHSYIHIWVSCHVTTYTMLMLLRGSDAHVYIHIWASCILTWQCIFTILRLLRGSYTVHVYDWEYHIHIWVLYSHVKNYTQCLCTLYTMLTIVHGCTRPLMLTSEHTLIEISYPYMVIFRSHTSSVSYWLAPMYVELVLTFNIALNMITMLVILRRCIRHCIHIVVDVLAFKVKMYSLHSLYTI